MTKKETVTEAFCRQSGIDPSHPNQSVEDEIANGRLDVTYAKNGKRIEILRTNTKEEQAFAKTQHELAQAWFGLERSRNLRLHANLNIPSNLPVAPREGMQVQETVEHAHFANYSHHLEQDRWPIIGGKGGGGAGDVEMGEMTSGDME